MGLGLGEQLGRLDSVWTRIEVLAHWAAGVPTALCFLPNSPAPWLLDALELPAGFGTDGFDETGAGSHAPRLKRLQEMAVCCIGTMLRLGLPVDFEASVSALLAFMARETDAGAHAAYTAAAWVGHELVAQGRGERLRNPTNAWCEMAQLLGLLSRYGCAEYAREQIELMSSERRPYESLEGFDVPQFMSSFCGLCGAMHDWLPVAMADKEGPYSPWRALHDAFDRISGLLITADPRVRLMIARCICELVEGSPEEFLETKGECGLSTALRRMVATDPGVRQVGFCYARVFLQTSSPEDFVLSGGVQAIQKAMNRGEAERCEELAWMLLHGGQVQAASALAGLFGDRFDEALNWN